MGERLSKILLGVRVYVDGTPYEDRDREYERDELGNELDRRHPWNKETKLKDKIVINNLVPTAKQYYNGKEYTPTTGDIARLCAYRLKKGKIRALSYEWEPRGNTVMERTFARIFIVAYLKGYLQQIEVSDTDLSPRKGKRGHRLAVGAYDAPRG